MPMFSNEYGAAYRFADSLDIMLSNDYPKVPSAVKEALTDELSHILKASYAMKYIQEYVEGVLSEEGLLEKLATLRRPDNTEKELQ